MATVTSDPGTTLPSSSLYDFDVDEVTVSNATTYSWNTWTTSSSGVVEHTVTLIGSFTYPGGEPSGSVAQILLDTDADGDTDVTIAYNTFVAGLLPSLLSGDTDEFLGAAFFQNDTITLAGTTISSAHRFFLGGDGAESDDNITITGSGNFGGDGRLAGGKTGGNDDFTLDSTVTSTSSTLVGDFESNFSSGAGGNDTFVDLTGAGSGFTVFIGDLRSFFGSTFDGGDDVFTAGVRSAVMTGDVDFLLVDGNVLTGGDDTLLGGSGNDTIYGDYRTFTDAAGRDYTVNGGNDSITGGDGDDLIYGEGPLANAAALTQSGGNDTIRGGAGNDTIYGGSGNDTMFGDADDDLFIAGVGTDTFVGGSGIDTVDYSGSIFGVTAVLADGSGAGTLTSGGAVSQVYEVENIIGSSVSDNLTGNDADNVFEGGGGSDTLDGGTGSDLASYANASSGVIVDLGIFGTGQFVGGGQGTDTLSNMEGVIGSQYDDTIFGSAADDMIEGRSGNDILLLRSGSGNAFPSPGSDTIDGGLGNDTIGFSLAGVGQSNLGSGHVLMGGSNGSGGDTFAFETFGSDYTVTWNVIGAGSFVQNSTGATIATLSQFENVLAGNGDDIINIGTVNDNLVDAGGGDDLIEVSGGENTVNGGDGNDTIVSGTGDDLINGGGEFGSGDTASYANASGDVAVYLQYTGLDVGGGMGIDTHIGIENLTGGDFNDRLIGDSGSNALIGGAGNDILKGKDGDDIFVGGDGDDRITGGSGFDTIDGGAGNDTLFALGGNDVLSGGDDRDFVYGGRDTDTVYGGNGDDEVRGNLGNDLIFGDAGIDDLRGGGNNDTLDGGADDDFLFGENGSDRLIGGQGSDALTGGVGAGSFDGAADTFVYADTASGGGGFDRIKDWEDGIDQIDLVSFGYTSFSQVSATSANGGLDTRLNFGSGDVLYIENFAIGNFDASDVILT